ncbi:hypothetical protein BCR32DRAFT_330420 [Anaeromyces robustus]|uniref:Uncharacterized protein n=1 Tax=Anaeromyces robustus TaxID=1754192 RepID=A0A1Y1VV62_9FUNG|nr:hypothetical protein BCR32DRAFT_330420 [Anaeromyces robustus]|eukprot:ORX65170.1 hypothetical protein BCR32DRAFT_330420 [Anaeromyces robustus]
MEDITYISVNNWFESRDYPPTENFIKWLSDDTNQTFQNDEWAKENKLCIYYGIIDMSHNYTISASREWVEKNCPELLTDKEYTYELGGNEYKNKYSDFVYHPKEGKTEPDCDRFNMPFRKYCEENFGSKYYETNYWDDDDDDDDNEESEKENIE